METYNIKLRNKNWIKIETGDREGKLSSNIRHNKKSDLFLSGIESLLLAMACSGIDISTSKMKEAI